MAVTVLKLLFLFFLPGFMFCCVGNMLVKVASRIPESPRDRLRLEWDECGGTAVSYTTWLHLLFSICLGPREFWVIAIKHTFLPIKIPRTDAATSPLHWKDFAVSKASGFEQKPSFPLKRSQPDLNQGGMVTHICIARSPSLFFLWLFPSCTVLTFSPKWTVMEVTRLLQIWSFLNELYHVHRGHRPTTALITEGWKHLAMCFQ